MPSFSLLTVPQNNQPQDSHLLIYEYTHPRLRRTLGIAIFERGWRILLWVGKAISDKVNLWGGGGAFAYYNILAGPNLLS